MVFLPESPRWLLSKDRHEEGLQVIAALGGVEESSESAQLQKAVIMDSISASGQGTKTPLKVVFTNGKTQHCRRMLLGASSQLMQQIGGCNAVIYYLPILFEDVSFLPLEPKSQPGTNKFISQSALIATWRSFSVV